MSDEFVDKIICGDNLTTLKKMPNDLVSLTVTSPVYNVDIKYASNDDNMPYEKYLEWLKELFTEIYRVTRHGGRCAINIDAMTNRQEDKDQEYVRCIYAHLYNIMKDIGWKFRTEICWYKQNAVGKKTAFGSYMSCSNPVIRRNHEYVLVWSKGDWKLDGDNENSDMEKEEFNNWTFSTWFIQPETRKLGGHKVPYPEELVKRIVKLFSYRGDIVLDPFNGSGTTSVVARANGRRYIGLDIDEGYCEFARNRVKLFDDNNSLVPVEYVPRSERIKKQEVEEE